MPYPPDTERIANLAVELQDAIGYNFPWEISHSDKLCLSHTTIEQIIQAITDLRLQVWGVIPKEETNK